MTQIKITPPPIEQKYIDMAVREYGVDSIYRVHATIHKAFLYAGAVGLKKYGKPADPHAYSYRHWFAKAVRHLWKYWCGNRYDADGQHHLGAALFAMVMLLAKTEG